MKDYRAYDLEDFLQNASFYDWVLGRNGTDASFWYAFPEKFPDKAALMKEAECILRAVGSGNTAIHEKEVRMEVDAFLEKISNTNEAKPAETQTEERFSMRIKRITVLSSASLALLVAVALLFDRPEYRHHDKAEDTLGTSANLVNTYNDTDKPLRIVLSDHSEVTLSPRSLLQYPAHFADSSRTVLLTGEADFSVEKGSSPFLVYAGDVVTKVLGTRFVVRAFATDHNTTVQVKTGTVSVFQNPKADNSTKKVETSGLIINANQAAVFERQLRQLTKTLVADPVKLVPVVDFETRRYDETALPKILTDLEKAYGITILFNEEQFKKCRITATLADENMYQKLDMLCKSIGASYEIVDGQILILGNGC